VANLLVALGRQPDERIALALATILARQALDDCAPARGARRRR
jgi:hypothetical protein